MNQPTRRVVADPATKPMSFFAIDQPLVDGLALLVHHLGIVFAVQPEHVPDELADLYQGVMASHRIETVED